MIVQWQASGTTAPTLYVHKAFSHSDFWRLLKRTKVIYPSPWQQGIHITLSQAYLLKPCWELPCWHNHTTCYDPWQQTQHMLPYQGLLYRELKADYTAFNMPLTILSVREQRMCCYPGYHGNHIQYMSEMECYTVSGIEKEKRQHEHLWKMETLEIHTWWMCGVFIEYRWRDAVAIMTAYSMTSICSMCAGFLMVTKRGPVFICLSLISVQNEAVRFCFHC